MSVQEKLKSLKSNGINVDIQSEITAKEKESATSKTQYVVKTKITTFKTEQDKAIMMGVATAYAIADSPVLAEDQAIERAFNHLGV